MTVSISFCGHQRLPPYIPYRDVPLPSKAVGCSCAESQKTRKLKEHDYVFKMIKAGVGASAVTDTV